MQFLQSAPLAVALCFGFLTFTDAATASNLAESDERFCRIGKETIYVGGGKERLYVRPSIVLNDYFFIGGKVIAGQEASILSINRKATERRKAITYIEKCTETDYPVLEDAFVLTNDSEGPVSVGSLCVPYPKIVFYASGSSRWGNITTYYEDDLAKNGVMTWGDFDAVKTYLDLFFDRTLTRKIGFDEKWEKIDAAYRPRLQVDAYAIREIIKAQCGAEPENLLFVVNMGHDSIEARMRPQPLLIRIKVQQDGWHFSSENTELAKAIHLEGQRQDAEWAAEILELKRQREAQWRRSREQAEAAYVGLLFLGIVGFVELSPCWDDPDTMGC